MTETTTGQFPAVLASRKIQLLAQLKDYYLLLESSLRLLRVIGRK